MFSPPYKVARQYTLEEIFSNIGGWPPADLVTESNARPSTPAPIPIARSGDTELSRADALQLFRDWASHVDTATGSANTRGGRNKSAYDIAAEGLGRGLDAGDVLQVVISYCYRSGLPDHEGQSAWRSACQRHAESPFTGNAPKPSGRGVIRGGRTVVESLNMTSTQIAAGTSRPSSIVDARTYLLADTGNVDRFADQHRDDFRHWHAQGWRWWDGKRWAEDLGQVTEHARVFAKSILEEALTEMIDVNKREQAAMALVTVAQSDLAVAAKLEREKHEIDRDRKLSARKLKHAEASNRAHSVFSLVRLAQSHPSFCLESGFDRDPWSFNVANGTIDLRTGILRPHNRSDLITKISPISYDPSSDCPTWCALVERIMLGDVDLAAFLQRAIGYCLTGETREQVLFILHGTGANGKSTFVETIQAMFGDYAMTTPSETLLDQNRGGGTPNNDVARLRGARLVTANETEDGRKLAISKVKDLTGGDLITARFLHREFFTFRPEFKLLLRTNHKPVIRDNDHSIWRRIRLIPFNYTVPDDQKDPELRDKLMSELPGILAWAVRGCIRWQMDGLGMPPAVEQATSEYRTDMDVLQAFLDDCCTVDPDLSVQATELYNAYAHWCETSNERALSQTSFGRKITEKGFGIHKGALKYRTGLRLRQ